MRCARGSRASLSAPRRTISPKLPLSFFLDTSRPPLLVARLPKEALINHYALARFNLRRAACAPSKIPQLYATSQDVVVAPGLQEPPRPEDSSWSRMRYAGSCIEVPEKTAFLELSVMRGSPPSSLLSRRKLLGGMRQAAFAVPNSC